MHLVDGLLAATEVAVVTTSSTDSYLRVGTVWSVQLHNWVIGYSISCSCLFLLFPDHGLSQICPMPGVNVINLSCFLPRHWINMSDLTGYYNKITHWSYVLLALINPSICSVISLFRGYEHLVWERFCVHARWLPWWWQCLMTMRMNSRKRMIDGGISSDHT